jgi:hypothetical protein
MSDLVYSREAIARDAALAAERYRLTGADQPNPYPVYSDAALAWAASYERSKQAAIADSECSA